MDEHLVYLKKTFESHHPEWAKRLGGAKSQAEVEAIQHELRQGLLGILRTSYPPVGNGRLGDAENPDFQPLIIGKPRHSLGFLPSWAHLSRSRQ
jgi:hypothetical protein